MRQIAEEKLLPADIDAQPPVQAAAALRSVIRSYRDEIAREQRLPKALVEQVHAAGFFSLVIPRQLGGLQTDPLTYVRIVELLAEAAGAVGWNLANNSILQLVALGLPDEGVHEIYAHGADTVVAGTAVMGGGGPCLGHIWSPVGSKESSGPVTVSGARWTCLGRERHPTRPNGPQGGGP